ncbi:carbamate kinase [Alterinioella nitratireducens]|jgi:carbamate kinase|uniref:carbamate kinase n=1 Tax=Alterinioella nitratireducens TaxID=2735915 RepID=UPI001553F83A|nr:carbamate kinase [Alterinioella nitratireducens]NPD18956.1 carbamate kinase [Alterinioella nitratireducens]
MLVVAALGGNALLQRGDPLTAQIQRANVATAAASLARIIKAGHRLVVTHGNGPQIGLLALQGAAYKPDEVFPLDVLGAETDGMIGYMIEQALENALGHDRPVATLLTQIEVDPKDPAFARPTKFIGPVYDKAEAERLAEARGWSIAADGQHWRRVVASPMPSDIPDLKVLELLLEQDVTLICAGGGGIPVVRRADGSLIGIEAVIDKDHATALLAHKLKADALLLLTDVEAVFRGFGTEAQSAIRRVSPEDAVRLDLPEGSMAPKVAAAASFVSGRDRYACVGRLEDALAMLEGRAGTMIANT